MNFINTGQDLKTVEYILKSMTKNGTPVQVVAHGKHGSYLTTRYKTFDKPETSDLISEDFLYLDKNNKINTLSQVKSSYKKFNSSKSLENFIKDNYFVSTGENCTHWIYRTGKGKYTDQRFKQVHRPVIDSKLAEADTPPSGKKPVCFLYGGGSASGKSTVINNLVTPVIKSTGLRFANLDCDELKNSIPEYEMFKQQDINTAASRVHRESSDLCNECIDAMIRRKKCFTFDGVMGNYKRYEDLVHKLKNNGYEVHIVAADVPVEIALQRASLRDRKIDDEIIKRAHRDFGKAFPQIMKLPVDSFSLYDNSQPSGQPNKCIVNSKGVQDNELYQRFLKKGGA